MTFIRMSFCSSGEAPEIAFSRAKLIIVRCLASSLHVVFLPFAVDTLTEDVLHIYSSLIEQNPRNTLSLVAFHFPACSLEEFL